MSFIDIPTALLLLGFLYLLAPAATWAVLAQDRSPAAAWWCMGGFLFGAAVTIASFATRLPPVIGVLLTNLLVTTSCALRIQSLRLELGRPVPWRLLGLGVALLSLFTVITHWGLGWYNLRGVVITAAVAVALAYVSFLAIELGRRERSLNAFLLAGFYALFVLTLLLRAADIVVHPGGDPVPVARASTTALLTLTGLVTAVAGHFCYLGMQLDRARRRERRLLADKARQDAKGLLQQQMRQVERQRSIDQMSVSLAHELSQPVAAVLTNAQTGLRAVAQQRMTAQELSPLLLQIEQSARHASRVIERIRSFIQPSRLPLQRVDLREVCHSASELAASDLRARDIELQRPEAPEPVLVRGDALELTQALLNGLRNAADALAHGTQPRTIRLSCGSEAGWAWLRVEDSGPGLNAEQLHSATDPFYTTKAGGLGLGLSIVESIAERHGGRLSLSNAAPGGPGGARFEVRLPVLPLKSPG